MENSSHGTMFSSRTSPSGAEKKHLAPPLPIAPDFPLFFSSIPFRFAIALVTSYTRNASSQASIINVETATRTKPEHRNTTRPRGTKAQGAYTCSVLPIHLSHLLPTKRELILTTHTYLTRPLSLQYPY